MADKKNAVQLPEPTAAEVEFAQQLVARAKADGVSLVGPGGLLAGITRTVLESALDAELDAHLDEVGVDEATGRRTNIRNGTGRRRCRPRLDSGSSGSGGFVRAADRAEARPPVGRVQRGDPVAVCQRPDDRGDLRASSGRV
ncbi:hypothetical protein [Micromonospora sp. NPDC093244]|uniref:transposase n=1 Tax=Micromonospora sp. NPDC093244 TaxID=3155071 RepID=UPI003415970B